MLILPLGRKDRILRYVRQIIRSIRVWQPWAILSTVCGITGLNFVYFWDRSQKNEITANFQSFALAIWGLLAIISVCLFWYYTSSYYKEKQKTLNVQKTYGHLHTITEKIRACNIRSASVYKWLLQNQISKDAPAESELVEKNHTQAREKCRLFAATAEGLFSEICLEIKNALHASGLKVSRVTLKYIDAPCDTVFTVAKDDNHISGVRHRNLSEEIIPQLLRKVHTGHDKLIHAKGLNSLEINSQTVELPFFALGHLESRNIPEIFSLTPINPKENHNMICEKIRQAAADKYSSFLAMACAAKTVGLDSNGDEVALGGGGICGFIGIDSPKKMIWEHLTRHHIEMLATICDQFYISLNLYIFCKKYINHE